MIVTFNLAFIALCLFGALLIEINDRRRIRRLMDIRVAKLMRSVKS